MPWHCSVPGATQALMIHASLSIASLQSRPEAQFDLTLLGVAELRVLRTGQRAVPTYDGHVKITSWIPTGEGFVQRHTQFAPSTTSSLAALEFLLSTREDIVGIRVVLLSFTAAVPRVTRASSSETDAVLPYASAWHSTAVLSWRSS